MILNKSYEILCQLLKKKNPVFFVVVETFDMVVIKGVTDFDHWFTNQTQIINPVIWSFTAIENLSFSHSGLI